MNERQTTTNSTFASGESAHCFVVAEIFVLRINICGENHHLRQNRYGSF